MPPALSIPPGSEWNNNVYILTTTRVFGMFGLAYLIKVLYDMVTLLGGRGSVSVAAGELSFPPNLHRRSITVKSPELTCLCHLVVVADSFDLGNIVPDTPITVPGAAGADPDLEANLTLEVRPPQPTYDPQHRTDGSSMYAEARYRTAETSDQSAAGQMMPGYETNVHNGDHYIEEVADTTVGLARHNGTLHSAAGEESGSMAARIPADAIHPPLDA